MWMTTNRNNNLEIKNMRRTERKHLIKSAAALALTLCLAAPLCACSGNSDYNPTTLNGSQLEEQAVRRNNQKVHRHIKEVLGFEIGDDYIEEAEMMLNASAQDGGNTCVLVKAGKEDALLSLLQTNLGNSTTISPSQIPAEMKDQYADELRQMPYIKSWGLSKSDKKIQIYMGWKGSRAYVYIFE